MGLFSRRDKTSELRSEVRGHTKKEDPLDKVRKSLKDLGAETYKDYGPQPVGERSWWVLDYDNDKTRVHGPFSFASDADTELSKYEDGEVFELRDVEKKSEAEKAITKILEKRLKDAQKGLRQEEK